MNNTGIILNEQKSVFKIIRESFLLYKDNFMELSKVMIFPIMAHLIGIPYILLVALYLPTFIPLEIILQDTLLVQASILFLTIPGFILFLKGFWAYLIAMISLCRYTKAVVENDKGVTIKSCTEYVLTRKNNYIKLLLLLTLLWFVVLGISFLPLFLVAYVNYALLLLMVIILFLVAMVVLLIVSVYLSLSFQVFAFEELVPMEIIKRSYALIKGNFWRTFLLMLILMIITGLLVPVIVHTVLQLVGIVGLIASLLGGFSETIINLMKMTFAIDFESLNNDFSMVLPQDFNIVKIVSETMVLQTIDAIVTAGMLPLGTIAFTMFYFSIIGKTPEIQPEEETNV